MHPFKKLCKHAQFEINMKSSYTEEEKEAAGGRCWKCNELLTLEKKHHYTSVDQLNIINKDEDDKSYLDNPENIKRLLEHANEPTYTCVPCWRKIIERSQEDYRKGLAVDVGDILEDLKNPDGQWRKDKIALIAEVEQCGPDCPYWERLDTYKSWLKE